MKENENEELLVTESELAPTPRTDAEAWSDLQDRQWIDAEVSRQLERELAAARVAIKVARDETNEHNPDGCTNHFSDGSKIFPNRDCCDQSARIAELERRVEEAERREQVAIASWDEERLRALREGERVVELRAEVERLTKERDQAKREWAEDFKVRTHLLRERDEARAALTQGHANPCTFGSLCPYCEIERLRAQLAEREEDRARLLLALELIEHATAPGGGGEFGVNGPDDGYHENAHELATAAIRAARGQEWQDHQQATSAALAQIDKALSPQQSKTT